MSHNTNTNSAPPIGWNIPSNSSPSMTSSQGSNNASFLPPAPQTASIPDASAPPLPKPRLKLQPSISLGAPTTLGISNEPDPFANLPKPVPVPIQRQGSQGGGGFGNYSPPPSRGSHRYQFKTSESFGNSSPPPNRGSQFNTGAVGNFSPPLSGGSNVYNFNSGGSSGRSQPDYSKPYVSSAPFGKTSGSSYLPSYKPSSFSSGSSSKGNTYGMTSSIVRDPNDLEILGKFERVNNTDEKFKMITIYVNNSHGIKDGSVKVHDIYELNKKGWGAWLRSQLSFGGMGSESMLLWYKTNPRGIQKLAGKMDGCVAFYDRLSRAFPENPKNMKNSSRQIIVLCAVSLGNVHKSPHGFQHWINIGTVPRGSNSVQGVGKMIPDFSANVVDDSFIIPSGTTKKNGEFKNYELDFNEYIVFDASRIKVKYAVDLEVFPASTGGRYSYSDNWNLRYLETKANTVIIKQFGMLHRNIIVRMNDNVNKISRI